MVMTTTVEVLHGLLQRAMGTTYDGQRNMSKALGYLNAITYEDALEKYKRQGMAARIVDTFPNALWSRPPIIIGNKELHRAINGWKKKKKKKYIEGLNEKVAFYHYLNRVEKLAGLGKYAILMLGFNDVSDVNDLKLPVKSGVNVKLMYMQAYGEGSVDINSTVINGGDIAYGMPEIYDIKVNVGKEGKEGDTQTLSVHHSRILHITDNSLESDLVGVPIIQRVYNNLDDLMKIIGGGSESSWLAAYKGMQFDLDPEMQLSDADKEKFTSEINSYMHGLKRVIRTRGVKINELGGDSILNGDIFNVVVSSIATTTGIPLRILIGSEQGKLASEQDRANLSGRIEERIQLHSEPKVLRPLITKLQNTGCIPGGDYELNWPDAFRLSPIERAMTSAQQARAAINLVKARELEDEILSIDEARFIIASGNPLMELNMFNS